MSSKILDGPDVVAYGMFRKITTLEFFQHRFAKMGHGNTSCDPHLYQSHQATNAPLPHARSEEHTSELQSRLHLVCRLLLEKKKNKSKEALYETSSGNPIED